ncbi:hypothetical protein BpHYR1_040113 [Brachionus plicatilis]|uniref:Uncharacterized protein n=1 Tax=Brachionus plicatilis TaxID=10195 RepID=A0A3M7SGX0_BRAPC|nr:hypothetical protein BpHYR1_040113 [Brachionus plicatilis]
MCVKDHCLDAKNYKIPERVKYSYRRTAVIKTVIEKNEKFLKIAISSQYIDYDNLLINLEIEVNKNRIKVIGILTN